MPVFYPKYDYNPDVTKEAVVGEPHAIPAAAPYEIYLKHVPRQESPSTVAVSGAGTTWVEVIDPPAASGEFRVDYSGGQGRIEFHGSDAGKSITVNYNACGTVVWAETYPDGREGINKIQETIEGHVGRTDNPHAVTAAQAGAVAKSGDTMTGPLQFNDANTKILEGAGNAVRAQTNSGYVDVGPQNTGYCHYSTDRPAHYFNKEVRVAGEIYAGPSYNQKVWHAGNDGAASGLDADLLDGYHASSFAVAPIPVTSLKKATGSWSRTNTETSASSTPFSVNQYALASPRAYVAGTSQFGGIDRIGYAGGSTSYVTQWSGYVGSGDTYYITWDYLTASGHPRIWAVIDDAGNIISMWEAEDPVDDEFPDECPIGLTDEQGNSIIPVGGAVVPVQFPSEQQLVALMGILAKTPMPRFASRGVWVNHKTPEGIVKTIFDKEMKARGLEPIPDVLEALSVQDVDKRNWRLQLWLRAMSRVRKDHRTFTLIPLFEEMFRVDKRTEQLMFK